MTHAFPTSPSRNLLRSLAAGAALAALAGCASLTPPRTISGMQAPIDGRHDCRAPTPNRRAAYNRPYDVRGRGYRPLPSADGYDATGIASWYGWESGRTTAMGTAFDPHAYTAASRVLPLPTCVQVTNLRNGRSVLVLVDDRGPFVDGRLMDLSYASAHALGIDGTAEVRVVALAAGQDTVPAAAQPAPAAASSAPPATAAATVTVLPIDASTAPPAPRELAPQPQADASPAPQPNAAPASMPRAARPQPVPSLYLQAASFRTRQRAQLERGRLRRGGIGPVKIVAARVHGQRWWRVQIGPLAQAEPDRELMRRLHRVGVDHVSVVRP